MWRLTFYEKEDGTIPVQEFLDQLPVKHLAKALRDIDILEKYGIALREPHVKHIDAKLWELRIKSASDISRIFYFVHVGENIVLLHGFVKKTAIPTSWWMKRFMLTVLRRGRLTKYHSWQPVLQVFFATDSL